MSGAVTRDGRLRCSFGRDSHRHWPRLIPCNRLAIVKYQPEGSIVYSYYCDEHAETITYQNDFVERSSKGFLVKDGKGYQTEIIPLSHDKQPMMIKDMGQTLQQITWDDVRYPQRMRSYSKAPDMLAYVGDISLLDAPSLSIVGMQQPTAIGQSIAYRIAAFFARQGYIIVSGLKQGIDVSAHQGALSGGGRTIAVMDGPLGNVYPRENRKLLQSIVRRGGLLLTSFYTNKHEVYRIVEPSYLQVILSLAVIPVQTGITGKTLHACRCAQKHGRSLWVPLPIEKDELQFPECYAGIRMVLKWQEVVPFAGKENYPMLLELLRKME
jgi:DNA processing protein